MNHADRNLRDDPLPIKKLRSSNECQANWQASVRITGAVEAVRPVRPWPGCVYSSDRTGPTDQDIRITYTLNILRTRINRVGQI